jgi:hypothetical protein
MAGEAMDNASMVFDGARALLDDPDREWATDDYLRPFVNLSYRGLASELAAYRLSFDERVAVLPNLPPGTQDLAAFTAPGGALAALWQPIELRERPIGGDDSDWTTMRRVDRLPAGDPQAMFELWEYREGDIYFPPATQALDLMVRFEEIFPAVASGSEPLRIIGSATALAYSAAALAARSRGGAELAADLSQEAARQTQLLILRLINESQSVRLRQRRFRPR